MDSQLLHPKLVDQIDFVRKWFRSIDQTSMHKAHTFSEDLKTIFNHAFKEIYIQMEGFKYVGTIKVLDVKLLHPTYKGNSITPLDCIKQRITYKSSYEVKFGLFIYKHLDFTTLQDYPFNITNYSSEGERFILIKDLSEFPLDNQDLDPAINDYSRYYVYSPVADFFEFLRKEKSITNTNYSRPFTPREIWLKDFKSTRLTNYGTNLMFFDGSNLYQMYSLSAYIKGNRSSALSLNTAQIPILVGAFDHRYEWNNKGTIVNIGLKDMTNVQRHQLGYHEKDIYYFIINGLEKIIKPTDRMALSYPVTFTNKAGTAHALKFLSDAYYKSERFLSSQVFMVHGSMKDHGDIHSRKETAVQEYNRFSPIEEILHYKYALYIIPKILDNMYKFPRIYGILTEGKTVGKTDRSIIGSTTIYIFENLWKFMITTKDGLDSVFYKNIDKYMFLTNKKTRLLDEVRSLESSAQGSTSQNKSTTMIIQVREINKTLEFMTKKPIAHLVSLGDNIKAVRSRYGGSILPGSKRGTNAKNILLRLNIEVKEAIQRSVNSNGNLNVDNLLLRWDSMYRRLKSIANPLKAKEEEDNNILIFLSTFTGKNHGQLIIDSVRLEFRKLIDNYHRHMLFMHMDRYMLKHYERNAERTLRPLKIYWSANTKVISTMIWIVKLVLYSLRIEETSAIDELNKKRVNIPSYTWSQTSNQRMAEKIHLNNGGSFNLSITSFDNLLGSILSFSPLDSKSTGINVMESEFMENQSGSKGRASAISLPLDEKSSLAHEVMLTRYYTETGANAESIKQLVYGSTAGLVDPLDAQESSNSGKNKALALGAFVTSGDSVNINSLVLWIHNVVSKFKIVAKSAARIGIMIDSIHMKRVNVVVDPTAEFEPLLAVAHHIFEEKSLIPDIRLASVVVDEGLAIVNLFTEHGRICKLFARPKVDLSIYNSVEEAIANRACIYITNLDNFMYMYPSNTTYALNEPIMQSELYEHIVQSLEDPKPKVITETRIVQRFEAPSAYVNNTDTNYSYRMIWPSDCLGTALSRVSGANQTSLARETYVSNMIRQALSRPYGMNNDNFKYALFGSKSIAITLWEKERGNYDAGFPMLTSLTTLGGATQEDSKVVSETIYGLGYYDCIIQTTQTIPGIPELGEGINPRIIDYINEEDRKINVEDIHLGNDGLPIIGYIYYPRDIVALYKEGDSSSPTGFVYRARKTKMKFPSILIRKSIRRIASGNQLKLIYRAIIPGETGVKGVSGSAQKGQTVATPLSKIPSNNRGIRITYGRSVLSIPSRMTGSDITLMSMGMRGMMKGKQVLYDSLCDPSVIYDLIEMIPSNTSDRSDDIEKLTLHSIKTQFDTLSEEAKWNFSLDKGVASYIREKSNMLSKVMKCPNLLSGETNERKIGVFHLQPLHHIGVLKAQVADRAQTIVTTGRKTTGTDRASRFGHMETNAAFARNPPNVFRALARQAGTIKVKICSKCGVIIPLKDSDTDLPIHGGLTCIICEMSITKPKGRNLIKQFFSTWVRFIITGIMMQIFPEED